MKKISIAFLPVLFASWFGLASGCKKPAPDCAAALDNAMKVTKGDMKGMDEKLVAKIKETSLARCNEDKWSNEVLKCFSEAKTGAALGDCENMKTQDQRDKLAKAIGALAEAGSGSAGSDPAGSDQGSGSAGSGSAEGSGSGAGSDSGSGSAAHAPAADAAASLERIVQEKAELDKKVDAAVNAVVAAQNDADRAAAKAKLDQLRKEKAELDQRVQAAKADAAKAHAQ